MQMWIRWLAEVYRNLRDVNIVLLLIFAGHHQIQVAAIRRNLHPSHITGQIHHLLIHSIFMPRKHAVIQQTASTRNAISVKSLIRKPFDEFP
ncbi:hypothetical protein Hanom_Chr07g00618421 [Helianthus anomalus]